MRFLFEAVLDEDIMNMDTIIWMAEFERIYIFYEPLYDFLDSDEECFMVFVADQDLRSESIFEPTLKEETIFLE